MRTGQEGAHDYMRKRVDFELYDLLNDPDEIENLILSSTASSEADDAFARLEADLHSHRVDVVRDPLVSEQERADFRSLYIANMARGGDLVGQWGIVEFDSSLYEHRRDPLDPVMRARINTKGGEEGHGLPIDRTRNATKKNTPARRSSTGPTGTARGTSLHS